jgi:hypothetical protein
MRVLGAAAALVLLGSAGAHAQVFVAEPAPVYVAPAPTYSPGRQSSGPLTPLLPSTAAPPSSTRARDDRARSSRTAIGGAGRRSGDRELS